MALPNSGARAAVVINEIHYHPPSPGGKTLEFVELFNDSGSAVDLGGWGFSRGIDFTFSVGTTIPAGGFVVVCRDPQEARVAFGLGAEGVFGPYLGVLDNGGENVVLVDEVHGFVDGVDFDDNSPWPPAADGDGSSLQRVCSTGPSWSFRNWSGVPGQDPSPLRANPSASCPLPQPEQPPVVINEIHYHPANDLDAFEEFVEIHNPTDAAVDISGWRFVGITFSFPEGTTLAAGDYLAVCRDEERVQGVYGTSKTIGNFEGQLSNSGERLLLLDSEGVLVDFVRYNDQGDWPVSPDAGGRSLERFDASAPSDDPASWGEGDLSGTGFSTISVVGKLARLLRQRVLLGVNGAGEYVVDDVRLERLDTPGENLIANGGFEEGLGEWNARGNAAESVVEDGIGVDGSMGLRLVGEGECSADCDNCSSSRSVAFTIEGIDDTESDYRLTVSFQYVGGSSQFYCRMLRSISFCLGEGLATPGAENSNHTDSVPPHIANRGRFPTQPTSEDATLITAAVRSPSGQAIEAVELTWFAGDESEVVALEDNGESGDRGANDGVYAGRMPVFEHDTPVVYHITARTVDGSVGVSPRVVNVGRLQRRERWGYYVNDAQPDSPLPIWQVIFRQADASRPESINNVLTCQVLEDCDFVFDGELYPDVGMRFRGNTACVLKKRNLKLKFNRGRWFQGQRKLNLQGIWTDKALVREQIAWEFIGQLGIPYCETEYIRVHLNGQYHGLFLYLEHPDERFLERNGIDGSGCLYKARQPSGGQGVPVGVAQQANATAYGAFWERETCKEEDFTQLAEFIGAMHGDARQAGGPTAEFHLARTYPEWQIGYQVSQIALNNIDSFAKNHFVLWDRAEDRWGLLTWDMDLVFGKNFDGRLNRPNPPRVGTINDCMLSPGDDLNPWFTTTVLGNTRLHHWIDIIFRAGDGYFRRAYVIRLWDILQEKYRSERFDLILDDLGAFLIDEQEEDFGRWGRTVVTCLGDCRNCANRPDMASNIEKVKEQIRLHRTFLSTYLNRFHEALLDHDRMKITEILYNPVGTTEQLEFVEVVNTSDREIDISGWSFNEGIRFVFPAGTTVPSNGIVVVARSRAALLSQNPEISGQAQVFGDYTGSLSNEGDRLRLVDAGPGHPATIDFLMYRDGGDWPDLREGHSVELMEVTPDTDNDDAWNWRVSTGRSGTPGFVVGFGVEAAPFLRGDSDGSGELNLADAVSTLLYLFSSGDAPLCLDGADSDDSGSVDLTDVLVLLNFLFRGGDPIPPPYPEPGLDPTPDGLFCE